MSALLDVFGFASVLLHGLDLIAQCVLVGSVVFATWTLQRDGPDASSSGSVSRRVVRTAAIATMLCSGASASLNALVLASSLPMDWSELPGAGFAIAGLVRVFAAAALYLLFARSTRSLRAHVAAAILCLAVIGGSLATTHAVARLDHAVPMLVASALHLCGAALWLGGLPSFRLALLDADAAQAMQTARRYSRVAIAGVGCVVAGAAIFAFGYLGSVDAVYGTAYGAMAATKAVLLGVLLLLGLHNFRAARGAPGPHAVERMRRFVDVEMGIGAAILLAAASITSMPPAVDLQDRVSLGDIAQRMTPMAPSLRSPDHDALAIPALQRKLDAEAAHDHASQRPQAFTPGGGAPAPRNASDIAWSEYNHHWAGLAVLAMGLMALLHRGGNVSWARHWPLLFLALGAFLFVRADPEAWPLGEIGFFASLRDPEVAQHRIFELLLVGFGVFEWRVRTGRIADRRFARVFPLLTALAATLLVTHSHALGNPREEVLIELTHLPIAVLGILAGGARWLEIEGAARDHRWTGWLWPACLVAIGLLLLDYREA